MNNNKKQKYFNSNLKFHNTETVTTALVGLETNSHFKAVSLVVFAFFDAFH